MRSPLLFSLAVTIATSLPGTAFAQSTIEMLIGHVVADVEGGALVDVRLLNTGAEKVDANLPKDVEGRLARPGSIGSGRTVTLHRDPETAAIVAVEPGRFAIVGYRLERGDFQDGEILSVPLWGTQTFTLAAAPPPASGRSDVTTQVATATPAPTPATPPPSDRTVGNAFIENLSAHEPIYAVYGPGTNSEARLQISFKYQLFGSQVNASRHKWSDGFYFAYTQRMFWDLGASSSPFRNIDFQPDLFYATPPKALSDMATLSAQIGLRHESNGRDGDYSRSLNTVYIAPMAAFSLRNDIRLTVAPRAWLYAGDLSDNPDIRRYRGNTGLFVEIGQGDGLRLSTSSRFNPSSGKGSIGADLSYPLRRILGGGPDFYLFAQTFLGYGENLLDYNRRMTRVRLGVALVR
ncbi:MAG: phospholipase [Sphingobium sp.]|uniref:phospholipase A n=1 Tax=Sphingobium sp. TaxID=1912891 RepID=UPI000DB38FDF|nr:phospholipase A [Sphingobium sp.]PZU11251.1 MAG: phospholipase [Sphingobium sp.]